MEVNESKVRKVLIGLMSVCLILIAVLVVVIALITQGDGKANDISQQESIDYELIEEIIRTSVKESLNEQMVTNEYPVDYERIEEIVDQKLEKFDKSFGEKFEDAGLYFGGKIKETYDDISEQFKGE